MNQASLPTASPYDNIGKQFLSSLPSPCDDTVKRLAFLSSLPTYIRRPPIGGRCPISGLNLTAIDRLIRPQQANDFKPPVRSKKLLSKNASRPIVLIEVRSLLDYLGSLPDGSEPGKPACADHKEGQADEGAK